jgi:hypothetical protein
MPVSWRIAHDVVWLDSGEAATFEEWRAAVDEFLAHPECRPGMPVIHDWRRMACTVDSCEIRARADYVRDAFALRGHTKWAIVASNSASYGMGRMAEALTDASLVKLRTFRDPADAEGWVNGRIGD